MRLRLRHRERGEKSVLPLSGASLYKLRTPDSLQKYNSHNARGRGPSPSLTASRGGDRPWWRLGWRLSRLELSVRGILRRIGLKLGRISKGRWEERAMMTKKVRNLTLSDATCRRLMTMPGVGSVTALTFVTAVDDPARFRRARDIGAWAGLTPKRSQSGERDVSGQITRIGDVALRTALFQAATVMLHNSRKTNWLKSWALRVTKRRGRKRAATALARRMGVVLLRMWRDGTEFRFTREPTASPDPA